MIVSAAAVSTLFVAWMRSVCSLPMLVNEGVTAAVRDGFLPKTVTSSKMRLVLAVGLEGTGHDFGEPPYTSHDLKVGCQSDCTVG